jgi:hypothetical protein
MSSAVRMIGNARHYSSAEASGASSTRTQKVPYHPPEVQKAAPMRNGSLLAAVTALGGGYRFPVHRRGGGSRRSGRYMPRAGPWETQQADRPAQADEADHLKSQTDRCSTASTAPSDARGRWSTACLYGRLTDI